MKEKEFNLSDERKRIIKLLTDRVDTLEAKDQFVILDWLNQFCGEIEKQDKEFIKLLKEGIKKEADEILQEHGMMIEEWKLGLPLIDKIDELAGDKLNGNL